MISVFDIHGTFGKWSARWSPGSIFCKTLESQNSSGCLHSVGLLLGGLAMAQWTPGHPAAARRIRGSGCLCAGTGRSGAYDAVGKSTVAIDPNMLTFTSLVVLIASHHKKGKW